MKIEKDFKNWDGQNVWVCDTNWNKRVIEPVEANLEDNYSTPYFRKISKSGKVSKSQYWSYNSSGSWRRSSEMQVFDNEIECKDYFVKACKKRIDELTVNYNEDLKYLGDLIINT